jgi:hypothetical protein
VYPVLVEVEPDRGDRNRLTVAFRLILAIPHIILVGAPGLAIGWSSGSSAGGVLGLVAGVCALIAWFAILFANQHPRGLWDLGAYYLRWRTRALPYMMLLRDEYPPFGDTDYPARFETTYPEGRRDKWAVGLRIFYVIRTSSCSSSSGLPGSSPQSSPGSPSCSRPLPGGHAGLRTGVFRWSVRVEAYGLLMRDEYRPSVSGRRSPA